ncbi:tyrosine-type recombinase/integrase [Streptomyces decoyicus]|uniref:tyrosine-type recombinase/integrase n=1 Tax=Streptomyces decoyicus TaxID=249567 RepID=UPI0033AA1118
MPGQEPVRLIFTAPEGGAWHSGACHAHRWKPSLDGADLAGLTKRPRIHGLRHTHASWSSAGKVPLPVIQSRLGHESITTTVDRYGHLLESSDAEVVAVVERVMAPPTADPRPDPRRCRTTAGRPGGLPCCGIGLLLRPYRLDRGLTRGQHVRRGRLPRLRSECFDSTNPSSQLCRAHRSGRVRAHPSTQSCSRCSSRAP